MCTTKKAISVPSSLEEIRYIIVSMFHPNKVRQVLTSFQSYQVLADFPNDEVALLARHENKKQEKHLLNIDSVTTYQLNYEIKFCLSF